MFAVDKREGLCLQLTKKGAGSIVDKREGLCLQLTEERGYVCS